MIKTAASKLFTKRKNIDFCYCETKSVAQSINTFERFHSLLISVFLLLPTSHEYFMPHGPPKEIVRLTNTIAALKREALKI